MDEKEIGKRIKELRLERGLTLEELGKKCNSTRGMVSRYESGQNKVPREKVFQIAEALGTDAAYIAGYVSKEEGFASYDHFAILQASQRESVQSLILAASKLTDEQVAALVVVAKGMAK